MKAKDMKVNDSKVDSKVNDSKVNSKKVDVDHLTDQVLRRLRRRLAVEGERLGVEP